MRGHRPKVNCYLQNGNFVTATYRREMSRLALHEKRNLKMEDPQGVVNHGRAEERNNPMGHVLVFPCQQEDINTK